MVASGTTAYPPCSAVRGTADSNGTIVGYITYSPCTPMRSPEPEKPKSVPPTPPGWEKPAWRGQDQSFDANDGDHQIGGRKRDKKRAKAAKKARKKNRRKR